MQCMITNNMMAPYGSNPFCTRRKVELSWRCGLRRVETPSNTDYVQVAQIPSVRLGTTDQEHLHMYNILCNKGFTGNVGFTAALEI